MATKIVRIGIKAMAEVSSPTWHCESQPCRIEAWKCARSIYRKTTGQARRLVL